MKARRQHHETAHRNGTWETEGAGTPTVRFFRPGEEVTITYDARGHTIAVTHQGRALKRSNLRDQVRDILNTQPIQEKSMAGTPPRLMITGSRTWTDRAAIKEALREWWESTGRNPDAVLVSGACPTGADRICEEVWEANGLTVERHPANWKPNGPNGPVNRRAGFDRNMAMADTGPDYILGFRHNDSRGTTHAYTYATKLGIPGKILDRTD